MGAILTQNVSWHNAKISVNNLKRSKLLSPLDILKASDKLIRECIRTSRFYNQKTEKLKVFCRYLISRYSGSLDKMFSTDVDTLRQELLEIKGIGKETADTILLYAGKKPSFVSDAYTKRFLSRLGLIDGLSSYDEIRNFFMKNIPRDIYLYNEYHALIVHHGYAICKSKPACNICPVRKIKKGIYCNFGLTSRGNSQSIILAGGRG